MAKSFSEKLIDILKKDSRFLDEEGEVIKSAVIAQAWKIDKTLVKLLLGDSDMKEKFFEEVDGYWVFDINNFIDYVSDKNFLANSYTRFRNRIGLTVGEKFLGERGEVSLIWPYKDCVLEGGQTREEEQRREIFFNEILAGDEIDRLFDIKVLTNFSRYTSKGEKKVGEFKRDKTGVIRENLIIKGNNLLTLHILKTQYRDKVKLIYIDPPYNTGNDSFGYNNYFNHSSWLTFMRNRLEASKELMSEDGLIFISCDDNEQAYLKILCDEIFGRDNFITQIIVQSNKRGQTYKQIAKTHEYLLLYSKSEFVEVNELEKEGEFKAFDDMGGYELRELRNRNPKFGRFNRPNLFYPIFIDIDSKDKDGLHPISLKRNDIYTYELVPLNSTGGESCWRWGKDKVQKNIDDNTRLSNLVAKQKATGEFGIYEKYRKKTYKAKTIWSEKEVISEQGTIELGKLGLADKFKFPKPSYLIKKLMLLGSKKDSIILDFFAGSGTTAHAVLDLNKQDGGNRNFIIVEQLDYVEDATIERVNKVMKSNEDASVSFIYFELMKYNEAYIDRIQNASSNKELVRIWKTIAKNSFLNWYVNPEIPGDAIKYFEEIGKSENGLEKQKRLLCELLNKNQLYVNLSEIDDAQFNVSEEDKSLNRAFY